MWEVGQVGKAKGCRELVDSFRQIHEYRVTIIYLPSELVISYFQSDLSISQIKSEKSLF